MNKWIRIDKLSPWRCFVLCLILNQERANKYELSSTFDTKSTPRIAKKAKKTFNLKK